MEGEGALARGPALAYPTKEGGKGWWGLGDPSLERGTDFAIFKRLRGAIVIHHAAGLLFLSGKKQRSEFFHLYRKRKNEKCCEFSSSVTIYVLEEFS